MRGGFRIGRLFGIDILLDWSWFLIFLLITWSLAAGLSHWHADWGQGTVWIISILASLLFFASVLAHELSHSLVAKAQGVPVKSIILFLFGGVSNIQRNPPSPKAEFLITIVGPLTSVVLGILFLMAAGVGMSSLRAAPHDIEGFLASLSPVTTLLLWLGQINIILGIFNMVPGFPLDGGRVLRSVLWASSGDLHRATRWASWAGQAIAALMIIVGIAMVFGVEFPLVGTGMINGLWLAFIGWFLSTAASQSYQQVVVEDVLSGVRVSQIMRANPPSVSPEGTVGDLVHDHIMQTDDHAFPVMRDESIVGLVTLDDVRRVPRDRWDTTRIHEVMTPANDLIVVPPDKEVAEALRTLVEKDIRQLPVLQDGRLLGLLRRRDIVKWMQFHSDTHRGARPFPAGHQSI